jgi:hypothetical protein
MLKVRSKLRFFAVLKDSAILPGVDASSIAANHVDMCKFEHEFINGFKSISEKLNQWIQGLDKKPEGGAGKNQVCCPGCDGLDFC